MGTKVTPRLARGVRDLMADQMLARRWMIDTIRHVYENYGFVPLETPAIEYLDVLVGSGEDEAEKSIFEVSNPDRKPDDPDEKKLGLRFDLTVPLARVMAQYPDLPRPFRRYQVSQVWRADKPDPGRFREFTQFDLDSVGVESDLADLEILAGMCDTLDALRVGAYRVRFSSRRVLNLLMPFAGIAPDQAPKVFRALDKLDKLGLEKLRLELTRGYVDDSGAAIPGLGLSDEQADKIETFLAIQADDRNEVLSRLRDTFAAVPGAGEEIDALQRISDRLDRLGYGSDRVTVDISVARGLSYYTGPVFEAILPDAPQFGSVFGGGRYDELVTRFSDEPLPAVGASIGVDRLLAALTHLGRVPTRRATAQVLVANFDAGLTDDYLDLTYELRRGGIRAELYLGPPKRIGKQFKYADQCGIPIVILYGSDEARRGTVTIKNMIEGLAQAPNIGGRQEWRQQRPGQFEVPRSDARAAAAALIARIEEGVS